MAKERLYQEGWEATLDGVRIPGGYKKRIKDGLIVFFKSGMENGKYVKTPVLQKVGESDRNFYQRIKTKYVDAGRLSGVASQKATVAALRDNVDKWSDDWLKTNASKYKPRQVDKFLSDFKKAWAAEVKAKGYKNTGTFKHTTNGFPALSARQGNAVGRNFNFEGFEIDRNRPEISFRKGFFANKLKDETFKGKLDEYFDYILRNKRGANKFKQARIPEGIKDVVYLLSPDSGVTGVAQTSLFKGISPALGKTFQDYIAKKNNATATNNANLRLMAKKLGKPETFFINQMKNEGKALKKLFDVKQLPDELKLGYSIEHTQGLAAAMKTNDINIIRAASKDLAGISLKRNMDLGFFGGFERNRGNYIQQIQEGLKNKVSVDKTVKDLNKMVRSEYKDLSDVKTPYSIVDNKLQVSPISKATTQEQRFGQYFNELANTSKSAPNLLKQVTENADLNKFIKEGQGDIYKNLRTTLITAAKTNKGGVCNLFRAEGGRIGFAGGSSCVTQMETAFDNDPVKLSQDLNKLPEQSGVLNKFKNAASKFLSVAKKGGRFAAFAGVGAAAGAVKQFMSDDPTSYLSDENQQKNMLIDMVTEPVMEERDPGITSSAQLPVLGAVTAAGAIPGGAEYYKDRRGIRPNDKFTGPMQKGVGKIRAAASPISGLLGKGLAATGTPLGMLALEPLYIGSQLAAGDSVGEIATNPINYLGAAFASPLTQQATKFASPAVSSIMRLGISPTMLKTVSRRFGLPGLALSAGISGYEMFNNKRQGRGLFDDG